MKITIGIDHGYGFMKTVHHTYRSGVKRVWSAPAFLHHALCYDGQYYIIGECGKAPNPTKTKDDDYYLLTLVAIALELQSRGQGTKAEVILGVGLPFDYWQAQKKEFKDYLTRRKVVRFQYGGKDYEVRIADVKVFPQGYAAVIEDIQKYKEANYIIDLGSYTMETLCVADKVPVMTKCGSLDKDIGLIYGMDLVKQEVRKAYGESFEDEDYMQVMQTKEKRLPPDIQKLAEQVIMDYTGHVLESLRQLRINTDHHRITWCGGGAKVMQTYQPFGDNVRFISNINANAKGYELLCSGLK